MAMNERIRKIRKEKHLTQQQFATALNISRNNIAGYETGTRTPSDAALNNICKTFNINENWLRNGVGDMFISMTKKEELLLWANTALNNESENFRNRFVDALSQLDVNDWELLANMAETLARQKEKNSTNLQSTTTSLYDSFPDTAEEFEKLYPPVDINEYRKKKKA